MSTDWIPLRFIDEEITARFEAPPLLSKKPEAPDAFNWRGAEYRVTEMLSAWYDFERRGTASRNMQPEHLATAARRGSWGVGRFYFRVRTDSGAVFDLYYDRAPKDAGDRAGHWFLWREMGERG